MPLQSKAFVLEPRFSQNHNVGILSFKGGCEWLWHKRAAIARACPFVLWTAQCQRYVERHNANVTFPFHTHIYTTREPAWTAQYQRHVPVTYTSTCTHVYKTYEHTHRLSNVQLPNHLAKIVPWRCNFACAVLLMFSEGFVTGKASSPGKIASSQCYDYVLVGSISVCAGKCMLATERFQHYDAPFCVSMTFLTTTAKS